jgi:integrase
MNPAHIPHTLRLYTEPDADSPAPAAETDTPSMATVADVIDWFLKRYTSTNEGALIEVHRILGLFRDRYGHLPAADLCGDDLVSFVESQPRVVAGNTVRRWYRTISQPFNSAVDLNFGGLSRYLFKGVRKPRGARGRDLTDGEFRSLLRLANPSFRRVLIFLRYSGARPCELRELTADQIRWHADGATIVKAKHKTSRTQAVQKARKIRLVPQLVKLLLWLKRQPRRHASDYVFVNSKGGPWRTASLCANLRRLRETAGLGADVKLYGTRHMFGTNAILNGVDIATLAELMGHARTSTTETYLHLADKDDHLDEAVIKATGRRHLAPPAAEG